MLSRSMFLWVKEGLTMSSDSCVGERKLLPVFKKLAKQNSILTLSNSYHGIVRFQDSRILWVNPECAVMKVKDCKTLSAPGGQIQLHNPAFARPVKATLRELNYQEGLLYLSGFSYSDREWQTRYHERVQPKNPAYAILNFNRHSLRAFI